jgi:Ti type entry exclusion protein TrbK
VRRLPVFVIAVAVLVVGAAATVMISMRSGDATAESGVNPAVMQSDADRRRRAEKFFGGDSNRNVRGGQEMKPRW